MAKTGLRYLVYSKITAETAGAVPTYSTSDNGIIGKAISADISVNSNDNPLYADNAQAEYDGSFSDASIKLNTADISLQVRAALLGATYTAADALTNVPESVTEGGSDIAPYVGIGFCKSGVENNVKYYEGTWYYKTKFKPFGETAKTKEKAIEWNTPEIEGTILIVEGYGNDTYRITARFTTESACTAWIDALAGIGSVTPVEPDNEG